MRRLLAFTFAAVLGVTACGGNGQSPTAPSKSGAPIAQSASGPSSPDSSGSGSGPGSPPPTTANSVELRGAIDTVTGSAGAFQFKIGSRVIRGDAQTTFRRGGDAAAFGSLAEGVEVEVHGQQQDGFIQATRIQIEDNAIDDDDDDADADDADDDDDDDDPAPPAQAAAVEGTLTAINGTAPILTLTVGTTTVRTSATTTVRRRGDALPFSVLATGQFLRVEGTRPTASAPIDARKIEIEDRDDDDDDDDDEVRFEGSVTSGSITGTCPSIRFVMSGTTVATSALTRFDDISCSTVGTARRLEVRGFRQSDGVVAASRVRRR